MRKKQEEIIKVMVDPEAIAKHRSRKGGRPCISNDVRNAVVMDYNSGDLSIKEISSKYGISGNSIYNILAERGYHEALGKAKSRDKVANT